MSKFSQQGIIILGLLTRFFNQFIGKGSYGYE